MRSFKLKRVFESHLSDKMYDLQNVSKQPKKFVAIPFSYHQEVVIKIEDITNTGIGVGRYCLSDGSRWVVMVSLVLIDEVVRVRIFRNNKAFSEADLIEVIEPSQFRVAPKCKYFSTCGGCQYQHIAIEVQREMKKQQVLTLLDKNGDISGIEVNDVVGTDNYFYYRTKLTPHFDSPHNNTIKIGFRQRDSKRIIVIDECIIATERVNDRLKSLRQEVMTKASVSAYKNGATLLLRECIEGVETDMKAYISQEVNGIIFRFCAGEFFQNNAYVLPLLVKHVERHVVDCNYLIDAYCGSGLFSLCLASSFERVWGIEISDKAVLAAKYNANINKVSNVDFLCGVSEDIFKSIPANLNKDETAIIIDPPRYSILIVSII